MPSTPWQSRPRYYRSYSLTFHTGNTNFNSNNYHQALAGVRSFRSTAGAWAPTRTAIQALSTDALHDEQNDEAMSESVEDLFRAELERYTFHAKARMMPGYEHYNPTKYDDIDNDASVSASQDLQVELDTGNESLFASNNEHARKLGSEVTWEEELVDLEQIDLDEAVRSPEAANAHQPNPPTSNHKTQKSAVELLLAFDPQNPPSCDDLEELQLWLECEAQQESITRYQHVIDSARTRKDYASLSLVQRHVLQWYQPLKHEIESLQKAYIFKEQDPEGVVLTKRAANVYGPFICSLPPEKLAVICAHEAIMSGLSNPGVDGRDGTAFTAVARRIGDAVEQEVVIQRMLHRRFKESQARHSTQDPNRILPKPEEEVEGDVELSTDKIDEDMNDGNATTRSKSSTGTEDVHKWAYAASHLKNYLDEISYRKPSVKKRLVIEYAIRRARTILENDEAWTESQKIQLGAVLFQVLLNKANVRIDGKQEKAFTYEKFWISKQKVQSIVSMNDRLHKMLVSDKLQSFGTTTTRQKPMIVPPKPWSRPDEGGYKMLRTELLRYHGCNMQKEVLQNVDLSIVFDGLNALGRVPWRINQRVLTIAQRCWDNNIPLGDIPSKDDNPLPEEPLHPKRQEQFWEPETPGYESYVEEYRLYRESWNKFRRVKQRNMDLRSLRCSAMLKLDQAEKFKEFEEIFFPYNMDFRGRAYPVPPHLSNVGSDLCRGVLKFAEAKPLGPRGLYWLKVHLANFAGKDKMSFDDRVKFVDDNLEQVRLSAEDPFAGERWWMSLEDPFQGLATCLEIIDAIDCGNPESFLCSLPVHMDGSCNGLQHYAALGRDSVGGKAVNLCAYDEPQDVYVGVMHEVVRRVAAEAERQLDFDTSDLESLSRKQKKELSYNRAAKLVNGLIDRGVVKRTVMTSVYGVTYIGARQQIQEKIISKLEAQGHDVDEMSNEVFQACGYVASLTMEVMGDLFTGARETMNWLTTCARMITQHGFPLAWVSPIGLPAIQPYRQKKAATIVTLLQTVTLINESDDLPIHKQRQVSAFPPNFIHSLDSSHMLLTALEMDRRGLTFSAVHDSFWTHACDIDEMNEALRDVFVDLYSQPLLERLKQTWEMRYPELEFPDIPKRGDLNLAEVKQAKYFFQ